MEYMEITAVNQVIKIQKTDVNQVITLDANLKSPGGYGAVRQPCVRTAWNWILHFLCSLSTAGRQRHFSWGIFAGWPRVKLWRACIMLLFDPFSQSQVGLKMRHSTEGERAKNQERVCLLEGGSYPEQTEARFMTNPGRREDSENECVSQREWSEAQLEG